MDILSALYAVNFFIYLGWYGMVAKGRMVEKMRGGGGGQKNEKGRNQLGSL